MRNLVARCCEPFPFVETGHRKSGNHYVQIRWLDDPAPEDDGDYDMKTLRLICTRCGKPAKPFVYSGAIISSDGTIEPLDAAEAAAIAEQFDAALKQGTGPFVFERPKKH